MTLAVFTGKRIALERRASDDGFFTSSLQKMLKEIANHRVAFFVGGMAGAIGHCHAVFNAEQIVDSNGVVERFPAVRAILGAAAD